MRCGEWWASSPDLRGCWHPYPLLPTTHLVDLYMSARWVRCREKSHFTSCLFRLLHSHCHNASSVVLFYLTHPCIFYLLCIGSVVWVLQQIVVGVLTSSCSFQNFYLWCGPLWLPIILLGNSGVLVAIPLHFLLVSWYLLLFLPGRLTTFFVYGLVCQTSLGMLTTVPRASHCTSSASIGLGPWLCIKRTCWLLLCWGVRGQLTSCRTGTLSSPFGHKLKV